VPAPIAADRVQGLSGRFRQESKIGRSPTPKALAKMENALASFLAEQDIR
jgi:hypothetical protein